MGGFTAHIGSRKNCIKSAGKLNKVSKHNERKFVSNEFDGSINNVLIGTDSVYKDVQQIYHDEFDEVVDNYNKKQKRNDRKIDDYFNHLSDLPYSKNKQDIAVEMIIQCEDMDFWKDKDISDKKRMNYIFKDQLKVLQNEIPDFKIANAIVHYDEASPHMHIIGVPVRKNCKKGLEKQVSKTTVFTSEVMKEILQGKLWERAEKGMRMNYKDFDSFKEKEEREQYKPAKYKSVEEYKKFKENEALNVDISNDNQPIDTRRLSSDLMWERYFLIEDAIKNNNDDKTKRIRDISNQLVDMVNNPEIVDFPNEKILFNDNQRRQIHGWLRSKNIDDEQNYLKPKEPVKKKKNRSWER